MGDTESQDRSRAKQRTSLADQRTDLADQRTEWAQRRTVLAREWTFSAWVRTGLSAVAAGLGIARLLQQLRPAWVPRALGTAFVLVGGIVFGIAYWRYEQEYERARETTVEIVPLALLAFLSLLLLADVGLSLYLLFAP